MLRPTIALLIVALCVFVTPNLVLLADASTPKRIALVVSNASYSAGLSRLESPHKDGDAVTAALEAIGFEVRQARDVRRDAFRDEILAFVKRFEAAGEGATSFFYFSGHGAADREFLQNFMLPIGEISEYVSLDSSAISLEDVIRPLEAAQSRSGKSFIVLDACRNAPPFVEANPRITSSFVRRDRVRGMLIGYATDEGQVAADANYFSNALASLLPEPDLEAVRVFKKVKEQVYELSGGRQTPWYEDGFIGDYYLARDAGGARQVAANRPSSTLGSGSGLPRPEAARPFANQPPPVLPSPVVVPAGALFKPGQAIMTRFSGLKLRDKGFVPVPGSSPQSGNSASSMLPDVTGSVIVFADLSRPASSATGPSASGTPPNLTPGSSIGTLLVTAGDIGQVYGAAVDPGSEVANETPRAPDLYLAATSAYGLPIVATGADLSRPVTPSDAQVLERGAPGATWAPGLFGTPKGGGPGAIWKVDGMTGRVTLFAEIALDGVKNRGPGLGQLAFDRRTRQLFVSDRQTGMIHRLSMSGAELGFFDHGVQGRSAQGLRPVAHRLAPGSSDPASPRSPSISPAGVLPANPEFRPAAPDTWGLAVAGRHVWGLAVFGDRLFYAVAEGPSIWSVGIRIDGTFARDSRREIEVRGAPAGSHVPAIDFDAGGNLYVVVLAGITAVDLQSIAQGSPRPTPSAVLRYRAQPVTAGVSPRWSQDPGNLTAAAETSNRVPVGAMALGYGVDPSGGIELASCGGSLWITAATRTDSSSRAGWTTALIGWSGSALAQSGAPTGAAPFAAGDTKVTIAGSLAIVDPCAAPRQAGGSMTLAGRLPELRPPQRIFPVSEGQTAALPNEPPGSSTTRPRSDIDGRSSQAAPQAGSQNTDGAGNGSPGPRPEERIPAPPACMSLAGVRFLCVGNAWELDLSLADKAGKGLDSLKVSSLSPNSLVEPGLQRRLSPADPFRIRFDTAAPGSLVPIDICLFDMTASLSGQRYRCCRAELRVELPTEPCGALALNQPPPTPGAAVPGMQRP